jgi:predicted DNA-binding ribbon-helix-helix protein
LVLALDTKSVHRKVRIGGKDSSLRLEQPFWTTLKLIAVERRIPVSQLITAIDRWPDDATNLSSAVRVFILQYARDRWVPKRHWTHE